MSALPKMLRTSLTDALGIDHPVVLAGMAKVANPRLAAAVSNAGGLGVIGGVMKTPAVLSREIEEIKSLLSPGHERQFGVDLLLPQVGGSARKTNSDYTRGKLSELIDIIVKAQPVLFVSAVGVPPKWVIDRLHAADILVMNMVGLPRHATKAIQSGCDLICAQGYEAGGHTGEVATSVLVPQVVDLCKGCRSPLKPSMPVLVIAAGGIYDGRGLAAALSWGASGVWVGTRFICAEESGAPEIHRRAVLSSSSENTLRTTLYTGRPCRVMKDSYNTVWERDRKEEMEKLEKAGIIVFKHEYKLAKKEGRKFNLASRFPQYIGQAAGAVHEVQPAREIVGEIVQQAACIIRENAKLLLSAPTISSAL